MTLHANDSFHGGGREMNDCSSKVAQVVSHAAGVGLPQGWVHVGPMMQRTHLPLGLGRVDGSAYSNDVLLFNGPKQRTFWLVLPAERVEELLKVDDHIVKRGNKCFWSKQISR